MLVVTQPVNKHPSLAEKRNLKVTRSSRFLQRPEQRLPTLLSVGIRGTAREAVVARPGFHHVYPRAHDPEKKLKAASQWTKELLRDSGSRPARLRTLALRQTPETQRFTAMLSPTGIEEWIGGASDDQCATLVAAVERRQAQLKCAAQIILDQIGLTVTVPRGELAAGVPRAGRRRRRQQPLTSGRG